MKELQTILKESARLRQENLAAVLATVVDVKGSGYRLPGAKMLISETGATFGIVSGGCLESDVLTRAAEVLKTGAPQVLTYDTTSHKDSVFSLNMGCNGITRILLESVADNKYFEFVENCFQARKSGVVATLLKANGENNLQNRDRYFFGGAEKNIETPALQPDGETEKKLFSDASLLISGGDSQCKIYESGTNTAAEFFFELVEPPQRLVIFGAGYDAVPLAHFAGNLGWSVAVVDHRAAYLTRERFAEADEIILSQPENLAEKLTLDEKTAAVVMTHNYEKDREVLRFLLSFKLPYIGALGPRKRTENLLEELRRNRSGFNESHLKKLFAPVGLDIGAKNPETIAVSIIAEIQSVLANRAGGFLRNRVGSIYERDAID